MTIHKLLNTQTKTRILFFVFIYLFTYFNNNNNKLNTGKEWQKKENHKKKKLTHIEKQTKHQLKGEQRAKSKKRS